LGEDTASRSGRGVYGISVASELSGIGPQTLRLYERWGLLTPSRTPGGTRRYSDDDLDRLKQITDLVEQGVNLAGIARILDLQSRNSQLESHNTRLKLDNAKLKADGRAAAGTVGSKRGRRGSNDGRGQNRGSRRNA
jgi:MerR family transcriptional regulator/heat shock protein HspR